ncbi:MAG: hypothetical protein WAM85_15250 [Terracidiphilus sp.]
MNLMDRIRKEQSLGNGSSELVRALALEKYVQPAIRDGRLQFSVAVKDLLQDLVARGFPPGNTPQVCTALTKKTFLRENGLEIEAVDGPPSKKSTTVVVRYRVATRGAQHNQGQNPPEGNPAMPSEESPEEWAHRLTGKLSGLLKDELAEYGGGEAFLRWVRSEDEDAA